MFNIDKYRSVTWQMGGRVWPVLDCYGVVHEVRRDLGLPEWPAFEGVIREGDTMARACVAFSANVRRVEAKEGAVAACYSGGLSITWAWWSISKERCMFSNQTHTVT